MLCKYCQTEIKGRRADAVYCSKSHRDNFNKRNKRKKDAELIKAIKQEFSTLQIQELINKNN